MTVSMKGGIPQEESYYPSLIEKVLHFFGKHIYPYTWKKTKDGNGYSTEVFEIKHCLYPNCKVYKIK